MLILPDKKLEQPVVAVLSDSMILLAAAAADYCNAVDKIASVTLQLDFDPKILHDTILAADVAAVVVELVEEDVEMLQQFAVVVTVVDPEELGAMIQYEVAAVPNYLE